ncbi:MAG TPA: anti-sigma F factor [Lachnospiraceae bacterium]|nr:anti-sigma F factor [Lachnospiraceae bacterium]
MENTNEMSLEFDSRSLNEGFARVAVAAFATQLNPTLEEVADLKTAVSEAVTNAIIHAYGKKVEKIRINCCVREREMEVEVVDHGVGIRDVPKAMEPMYTTKPELDRSGMGFAFMEAFMDELQVRSEPGVGTTVWMKKKFGGRSGQRDLSGDA